MRATLAAVASIALLAALPAGDASAAATSYQAGPGHSGFVARGAPRPPLVRRWSTRVGRGPSYPVVGQGRAFVVGYTGGQRQVTALSVRSGRVLWRRPLGRLFNAALAFDGGRLFVALDTTTTTDGPELMALDPADGRVLWAVDAPRGQVPAAVDGAVYVAGSGRIAAYRQSDGGLVWEVDPGPPGVGDVATVAGGEVLTGTDCAPHLLRVRRADGAQLTAYPDYCDDGEGGLVTVAGRRLLLHGIAPEGAGVYDRATARLLAPFESDRPAAAARGVIIRSNAELPRERALFGATLVADAGGRVRWRFRGDGYLDTPPLIAGRTVYVGSGSGRVYGVDLRTGRRRWTGDAGAPAGTGLAAAGGVLFVGAKDRLVAFGSRRGG